MVLKIVTSVYELNYEDARGGMVYKSYPLLTQTLRNIIFDDFEYVIYTNQYTYDKYHLGDQFNQPNITIKFHELNSENYLNNINPIRNLKFSEGEIHDRIYSVKNYIEVIFNKLQFLLDECEDNKNVVWIDSGLFGTSCHDRWRDYINVFAHSELFLNKINEKISDNGFICLRGESIQVNYELKAVLVDMFNTDFKLVPGGLFGGDSESVKKVLSNYSSIFETYYTKTNKLISEQEVLSILTHTNDVKFFNFEDWLDLQKGILDLMDLLDNNKYKIDSILGYTTDTNIENILDEDITFNSFTELSDKLGIDKGSIYENHMYSEVYEKMLSKYINKTPVIIEIGVHDTRFPGGCLKFWDLIFPNMEYYGFDIVDCNHLKCNREKITTIIGDQNKPEDLMRMIKTYDLSGKVDFIIDDGSHISEHIITSFKTLYPHIKKGGYYFIEDLHPEYANRDYTISTINSIIDEYKFEVTNKELVNNDKLWIITK